ncbi:MAG: DEAD/DEAH box helicase [Kiritimatiellae bacterium]|nr:DEAD/DEAH box helicase [Kiritimatiellia bacterium]
MKTRNTQTGREIQPPNTHNWHTTDQDEINRRKWRARHESFRIRAVEKFHPVFSNFHVTSLSGMDYQVEIRDLRRRQFSCNCVDFSINGLATCKHVEAVLNHLKAVAPRVFRQALCNSSGRMDIVPDMERRSIRVERNLDKLPRKLRRYFDSEGRCAPEDMHEALAALHKADGLMRVSQDVASWLQTLERLEERKRLRRDYEQKILSGEYPQHETKLPLFPYQREGMLHLAFTERALLADEMGLGKTIQAIAACALLRRIGKAQRVLVVTPASLKTEWEDQIQRFADLPLQIVFGSRHARLENYARPPFFTIVNYEQIVRDVMDVNARLKPDIVILDEAQRIKNWDTKTAQAVKRLKSRYAFVLTGTPLENRIDEIYSITSFLDPSILGPLFRFNRDFYRFDERGRPEEYQNLDKLHQRIRPVMLRRRKADVETELPGRTDQHYFVPMSAGQQSAYTDHEARVARLISTAKRRPLTRQEQDKLMRELAMMRMICDTNYILDPNDRVCPKLAELDKLFDSCLAETDAKIIVFSEWERMLELVRDLCKREKIGYAWHTGSVPQRRRRAEIMTFKSDPACRVFLSTDSGGVGLNLQNASVVVNCDLPWNPAKLEQRIGRAWRKFQTKSVTVVNLVAEKTIESRMLETLAAKKGLADGVLDGRGDFAEIKLKGGRQAFLQRLQQIMTAPVPLSVEKPHIAALPADRALGFSERAAALLQQRLVACEEQFPAEGAHSVMMVVVDRDAESWREQLGALHAEWFGKDKTDPLAPVRLQVIDRAAAEALKQMAELGLIATAVRATRHLFPVEAEHARPLTPEEQRIISDLRKNAARKLKAARALAQAELADEAHIPLAEAVCLVAKAKAAEKRWEEPKTIAEALTGPLAHVWGASHPELMVLAEGRPPATLPMLCDKLESLVADDGR